MGLTHAQLTESSVSGYMTTPDRKGREGKGSGRESRGETSHHGVAYVTRVSAAPAPVEPRDDMMAAPIPTLYHFTCADHGRPGIERTGRIVPGSDLGVTLPQAMFAWFTDLEQPHREALGLTNRIAKCDRLAHRYAVRSPKVMPWMGVRRALPRYFVDMLEETPGAMPRHWFVAAEPIEVLR